MILPIESQLLLLPHFQIVTTCVRLDYEETAVLDAWRTYLVSDQI